MTRDWIYLIQFLVKFISSKFTRWKMLEQRKDGRETILLTTNVSSSDKNWKDWNNRQDGRELYGSYNWISFIFFIICRRRDLICTFFIPLRIPLAGIRGFPVSNFSLVERCMGGATTGERVTNVEIQQRIFIPREKLKLR